VRTAHDEFLTLRLPAAMRRDLDAAAHAGGVRLSVATRTALALGLASIRSAPTDPRDPSPSAPGARSSLPVAA
jgi:hypothetical protein